MSKVCQRTQPLSCSRYKRNGCKAQAQAALPAMMSGLDGCLRADETWVGSGEKEGESFHVCFSAAQCWLGTVAEQGSAWSASLSYVNFPWWWTFVKSFVKSHPPSSNLQYHLSNLLLESNIGGGLYISLSLVHCICRLLASS